MFERYAESVIDDPLRFNSVEVHDMYKFIDSDGVERYETADEEDSADAYSVYVHLIEGGIECCGDFDKREDALRYGNEVALLHSWALCDFTTAAG